MTSLAANIHNITTNSFIFQLNAHQKKDEIPKTNKVKDHHLFGVQRTWRASQHYVAEKLSSLKTPADKSIATHIIQDRVDPVRGGGQGLHTARPSGCAWWWVGL